MKKYASFDLVPRRDLTPEIPVGLNGVTEKFVLDTAGVTSTIARSAVDALHLDEHRLSQYSEIYHADGSVASSYVSADRLAIGPIEARNVKLVIEAGARGDQEAYDGTLGPDLLRNFDLDFDFAARKLNLISPDHCKGKVVYWAGAYATIPFRIARGDEHIGVPVALDGHEFIAVVDTGATFTQIRAKAARAYFDINPGSPGVDPIPGVSAASLQQYQRRFQSLSLGGVVVKNPVLAILPDGAEKAFQARHSDKDETDPVYGLQFDPEPIVLGMDVLSKLHLYVAYGEKTLYVTAADAGRPLPAAAAVSADGPAPH